MSHPHRNELSPNELERIRQKDKLKPNRNKSVGLLTAEEHERRNELARTDGKVSKEMNEPQLFEFWDIGEEGKIPNLTATSCGKILQATIKFGGKFKDWHVQGLRCDPDRNCSVAYRIILPHGQKEAFEQTTGYTLTRSQNVGG